MNNYLIAAGKSENAEALASLVIGEPETKVDWTVSSSEAKKMMESGKYDVMVVNTPLTDGQGLDLCVYICEKLNYPVVLITSQMTADRIFSDFVKKGIIVVPRPIDKTAYHLMIQCTAAFSAVAARLRERNQTLEEEISERRLVARAKARLMKNMGMSEGQAHRFIEKQSMDLRKPKKEIAQSILKTYYDK